MQTVREFLRKFFNLGIYITSYCDSELHFKKMKNDFKKLTKFFENNKITNLMKFWGKILKKIFRICWVNFEADQPAAGLDQALKKENKNST